MNTESYSTRGLKCIVSSDTISFAFRPGDTVLDVKTNIAEETGFKKHEQNAFKHDNKQPLDDAVTLGTLFGDTEEWELVVLLEKNLTEEIMEAIPAASTLLAVRRQHLTMIDVLRQKLSTRENSTQVEMLFELGIHHNRDHLAVYFSSWGDDRNDDELLEFYMSMKKENVADIVDSGRFVTHYIGHIPGYDPDAYYISFRFQLKDQQPRDVVERIVKLHTIVMQP